MFVIQLDLGPLVALNQGMKTAAEKAMTDAGRKLVAATRAHIAEEANKRLHTRRQMYIDGLKLLEMDDDTFVVSLDAKVRWIDDGLSRHSMVNDLLKAKGAKTAKDGSRYAVIPFEHGPKGPTQMTPAQSTLLNTIKAELKKRDIPYGKLEKGADGKPKLGFLHGFDIKNAPIKTSEGPGQGKGPVGQVMQGPTGIPLLQGVRIYQRKVKDKEGNDVTKRQIMTFRVVSSKHLSQGRWEHPGQQGLHLFEEAHQWALKQWDEKIVPQLMQQFNGYF